MAEAWFDGSRFADRRSAGRQLADALAGIGGLVDPIVLALPRGGVPVGFEVARRLGAPLDVLVVRKLGTPGQEELALGAVASGGATSMNERLIAEIGLPASFVERIRAHEMAEVERRTHRFRGDRPWPQLRGRSVVIVDDGAATGATVLAALSALRLENPGGLIVALPVAPPETCDRLRAAADRVICLQMPSLFFAIGTWYRNFDQVADYEVANLLREAADGVADTAAPEQLATS